MQKEKGRVEEGVKKRGERGILQKEKKGIQGVL